MINGQKISGATQVTGDIRSPPNESKLCHSRRPWAVEPTARFQTAATVERRSWATVRCQRSAGGVDLMSLVSPSPAPSENRQQEHRGNTKNDQTSIPPGPR